MHPLRPFAYFQPETLSEAGRLLLEKGNGGFLLAGGTDLLVRMKRGEIRPSAIINIKGIQGLKGIEEKADKGLCIGALDSVSALEQSPLVRARWPVLARAAGSLGSPSLRNLATIGGNIGRASPASDLAPSLLVLQARLTVEGPRGKRELPLDSFFLGPGKTALGPGEIITSFQVPKMPENAGASFMRLARRRGMDCALVGVAVLLCFSEGRLRGARIALSSVAPTPIRAARAEGELLSGPLTPERIEGAARAAVSDSSPQSDMRATSEYRREMIRIFTSRAIREALERGGIRL